MRRLFRQFSFPGGIPSHVAPETPGSIHEGGELGYSLAHAYGAAFDNPDLLVCCVVGDGEAETGPLAASWHSNKFLNPVARRRGAADPAPQRLQDRQPDGARAHPATTSCARCSRATATRRTSSRATSPRPMHQRDGRRRSTRCSTRSRRSSERARERRTTERPRWPMIVLRTPKGWTGPKEVDGVPVEGTWRSHQVPLAKLAARTRSTCAALEEWMRSYRPEELFDEDGAPRAGARWRWRPTGERRMGANPHANGGAAAARRSAARLPRLRRRRAGARRRRSSEATRVLGAFLRDVMRAQRGTRSASSAPTRRRRTGCRRGVRGHRPRLGGRDSAGRRPPRARRPGDGGALRAPLPGLARGLPAHRPARPVLLLRGVHPHRRLDVQPAREVAEGDARHPVAAADRVAQLPAHARTSGARTTTASRTRTRASSTTSSTRRPRSSASTCRPTPTRCCRSATTACAAATTST